MPANRHTSKTFASVLSLAAALTLSAAAHAADPKLTVTTDPGSDPESVTQAPDGSLILGSAPTIL